ncbi:MAG: VOC family protein [Candidatus Bathyarchaeota archaeon]|nr:VOC family protein [Candidatus Bathyarchaeota archaeon]
MKILKVDHMHFFATDLDKYIEFYKDLGFEFVHKLEHGGREAAQLKTDFGFTIDLNKTKAADNPGYSHFAMLVDDVDEAFARLSEKGYEIDGPVVNKETKRKIITLRDPNGFLVQLVESE